MKKIATILLAAAMAFGLMSCGDQSKPDTSPSQSGTNSSAAQSSSQAQDIDWPKDPININVTGNAGGSTDLITRVFAEYYSKELGVPVVLNNGEGILQYQSTHDAQPDGYTMCTGAMGFMIYGFTGTLDFGLDGYDPISVISEDETFGLWVTSDAPYQTVDELVDYMKAHPGDVTIGMKTSTSVHLEVVGFLKSVGCEANVVDAGGDAARVTALLGGQINVTIEPLGSMKGYMDEGIGICLGTFQKESCVLCPDIPTIYGQGYDFTFPANMQALMLPKGVDPAIVAKASAAAQRVLENPDYVADINALSAVVNPRDYAEVNEYLQGISTQLDELVQEII